MSPCRQWKQSDKLESLVVAKTRITEFQTHTTPPVFLLGAKERAELGTEEVVLRICNISEGILIVKDNPEDEESDEEK